MQLLIKNGRVWDGEGFFYADVLTDGGIISRIGQDLICEGAYVFDAEGMTVSPGLVDCHMHMCGLSGPDYAIPTQIACFPFGVTAAADAGSSRGNEAFLEQMAVKSVVFAGTKIEENHLDREVTAARLARYGKKAVGIKLFYGATSGRVRDITPLQETCAFARQRGLKVTVHCNGSPTSMLSIVETLAPGDILTHIFHGGKNDCTENDFAALRLAREKGVILDAGFAGHVHTDFRVLETAVKAGFLPDCIGTDITSNSAYMRGGRYGMTMSMSMARTAGMAEEDIFRAVTVAPAKALGTNWGRLQVGGPADIAVFDYGSEGFRLTDRAGNTLENTQGYRCKLTVADGTIVFKD